MNEETEKLKSESTLTRLLHSVGHIFMPLIPAFIGCGLLVSIINIVLKFNPELAGNTYVQYLQLAGGCFFAILNGFVGLSACRTFGGTPILGSATAALLASGGLAKIIFMGEPLVPGRGGIFASMLAGATTAFIETRLRKHIPEAFNLFLTPLLTITFVALASLFILQPLAGYVAQSMSRNLMDLIIGSDMVSGFILGGIFLPMVATGVHHWLIPIHMDMMMFMGLSPLFPMLAMAGCGQVGAAFAVYLKSKNKYLRHVILSSLPVGMLGVGEPLIYGVTLPLGRPFIGACIGGAFGGAWQAHFDVGSYVIGISGLPLATSVNHVSLYLIGVLIAYAAGFLATCLLGFEDPSDEAIQEIQKKMSAQNS